MNLYVKAFWRIFRAFLKAKHELAVFFILALLFLAVVSSLIYAFEHPAQPDKFSNLFQSLWWAVITLTTVGYGDVYPITIPGQVLTMGILVVGLGIVFVPTGLFVDALAQVRDEENKNDP